MKKIIYITALILVALCPQVYAGQRKLEDPSDVLRRARNKHVRRVMQSRCEELTDREDCELCHVKKRYVRERQRADIRAGLTPTLKKGAIMSIFITWGLMPPTMFWAKLPFVAPATFGVLSGMVCAFHNEEKDIAAIRAEHQKRTKQMDYHEKRWNDSFRYGGPRQASKFDEPLTDEELETYLPELTPKNRLV